jgi:hypothetical protein
LSNCGTPDSGTRKAQTDRPHLRADPGWQHLTHAAFAERFLDLVPRQVHDLHIQISVTGQVADVRKRRLTTAAERRLITIRGIPRHGKLKISDYCLLATSDVYIPCMSPRNHADCTASRASLAAACWHSSG